MTDKIVVLSTVETEDQARKLARALVEDRLAACVNIVGGVNSVYRWQEEVQESDERLLLIKTNRELLPQVRAAIERLHSYELPEVIALPIVDGSERYLRWLAESLESA
jgi:periplasmic divalent cation tolerance protein